MQTLLSKPCVGGRSGGAHAPPSPPFFCRLRPRGNERHQCTRCLEAAGPRAPAGARCEVGGAPPRSSCSRSTPPCSSPLLPRPTVQIRGRHRALRMSFADDILFSPGVKDDTTFVVLDS